MFSLGYMVIIKKVSDHCLPTLGVCYEKLATSKYHVKAEYVGCWESWQQASILVAETTMGLVKCLPRVNGLQPTNITGDDLIAPYGERS